MCAGTPTTFSSCRAVSGVMAFSPLKTALSFAGGRRMRRASSSLVMSSSAITSSRYSPGGIARSEWMDASVAIVFAHLLDVADLPHQVDSGGVPSADLLALGPDRISRALVLVLQLASPERDFHAHLSPPLSLPMG